MTNYFYRLLAAFLLVQGRQYLLFRKSASLHFKVSFSDKKIKTSTFAWIPKPISDQNLALCESLYPAIHLLEIVLRNQVHSALTTHFQEDWLLRAGESAILREPAQKTFRKSSNG